eukprot:3931883-Rhodomonas_salina.1
MRRLVLSAGMGWYRARSWLVLSAGMVVQPHLGHVWGWLPTEESDYICEANGQPEPLWRVRETDTQTVTVTVTVTDTDTDTDTATQTPRHTDTQTDTGQRMEGRRATISARPRADLSLCG